MFSTSVSLLSLSLSLSLSLDLHIHVTLYRTGQFESQESAIHFFHENHDVVKKDHHILISYGKFREEDWFCDKCKCRNFRSRNECFRCHLPKGDGKYRSRDPRVLRDSNVESGGKREPYDPRPRSRDLVKHDEDLRDDFKTETSRYGNGGYRDGRRRSRSRKRDKDMRKSTYWDDLHDPKKSYS